MPGAAAQPRRGLKPEQMSHASAGPPHGTEGPCSHPLQRNTLKPARIDGQAGENGSPTPDVMSFFRSTLLPAAIVLIFGLALFAVSARIWLPGDMAAPAPIS